MGKYIACVCWTCQVVRELTVDEFIEFYEIHWGHKVTVKSLGSDGKDEYTHLPHVEAEP